MSRGEELLAAICADPADIEARLVYGDWLTESGDPRGAYVVQHCRLEAMSGLEDEHAALHASTRRLEAAQARDWLAAYVESVDASGFSRLEISPILNAVFRHGFLHRIAARPTDIAAQWNWLREREPIQGMELLVGEGIPRDLGDVPHVATWRALKISPDDWFTGFSVGDVFRWGTNELRELDLSGCDLGGFGSRLLANQVEPPDDDWQAPPPLPEGQLTHLAIRNTGVGDEGATLLFEAKTLSALEGLDISQCKIKSAATLEALRASDPLAGLGKLAIAGNNALGGQLAALAGWPALEHLGALTLPQSSNTADLAALFPTPSAALRELDVASARDLLASPQSVANTAEALTHLNVGMTRLGDARWAALLGCSSVRRLAHLAAYGGSLSDKGVQALVDSDLASLVTLDLSSNKLTDAGLANLAGWPGLKNVTRLRLGNNRKLTGVGYQALVDSDDVDLTLLDVGKSTEEIVAPLRERFGKAVRATIR